MQIFFIAWGAIVFAVISSYLNVLIQRGWRESIQPRSVCDACGKKLNPAWMVPVFSALFTWLFHRSKSYCCQKEIPAVKYFFTELLGAVTGGLLAWFLYNASESGKIIGWSNLCQWILILIPIVITFLYLGQQDIWFYAVSTQAIVILICLIALSSLMLPAQFQSIFGNAVWSIGALLTGIIGAAIVGLLIIVSKGKGLGSGDVLLLFVMGVSLGGLMLFISSQLSIYLATIFGMMYAAYIRKFKGIIIPLVPFLYLGWFLAVIFRPELLKLVTNLAF